MVENTKSLAESWWPVAGIAVISGIGLVLNVTSLSFFWRKRDKLLGELANNKHSVINQQKHSI